MPSRDRLRVAEQHLDRGGLLERRTVHAAGDFELHARVDRLEPQDLRLELRARGVVAHAQIDRDVAMLRNDIRRGAAADHADRRGDAARVIGHLLDRQHLPRHLADRAAAVLMARAGVRRNASRHHLEAADTFA